MKKIIIIFIIFAVSGASAIVYFNSPPAAMQEQVFTVSYGDTMRLIARNLKKKNLIMSRDFFVYSSYALRRHFVKAGKYRILSGNTSMEILKKLTRGEVLTRKVTIPEGFNIYQIADRMESLGITDSGAFLNYAADATFLKSIKINSPSVEGYLFPDTYVFPEGSDAREVIATMYRKMKGVTGAELSPTGRAELHRVLTLASLVEKEAKVASERELISSVFHNRLERNMKLDCDPTVRYAVKKFTGPITVSNLNTDSPYNTYRRGGLPPSPICSPGKGSIIAALHPSKSEYLYFVAKNDGSHYFSKTLKEHINAVNKWQRGR